MSLESSKQTQGEMKSLKEEEKGAFPQTLRRTLHWRLEDRVTAGELVETLGYKIYWQAIIRGEITSLLYEAHLK